MDIIKKICLGICTVLFFAGCVLSFLILLLNILFGNYMGFVLGLFLTILLIINICLYIKEELWN